MATGGHRLVLATADDAVASSFEKAAKGAGWAVDRRRDSHGAERWEGIVVLDDRLPDRNAYEVCRALSTAGKARVFVAHRAADGSAPSIARFCGAAGTIVLPAEEPALRQALAPRKGGGAPPPESRRGKERPMTLPPALAEKMLREHAAGEEGGAAALVELLCDPETKLFNAPFALFKLDEEFKRAGRFKTPLACVVVGFDGEASADDLLDLGAVFLGESRDVDLLGRFDLNRFLFLLPSTGEEGARTMAARVVAAAKARKLRDLTGDPIALAAGVAIAPGTGFDSRDDLLQAAQAAFERALAAGGGVEVGTPAEPSGRKSR